AAGAALFGALVAACAPTAAPPAKPAASAAATAPAAVGAAGTAAAPSAPAAPRAAELPTTPVVDLKVGVLAVASWGPLFVAKDLWDAGTIRTAGDLVGRTVYLQAGEGSAPYVQMATWLLRQGIDPHSVDVANMFFPDVYAAMLNKGIEVGYQSEPLLRMGLAN